MDLEGTLGVSKVSVGATITDELKERLVSVSKKGQGKSAQTEMTKC